MGSLANSTSNYLKALATTAIDSALEGLERREVHNLSARTEEGHELFYAPRSKTSL